MAVSFFSEGIAMPAIRRRDVSAWIRQVAQLHGKRLGEVCYKFVNDEGILDCNRQFLGHDYYTDIITFDYSEGDKIAGDIVISLDTVRTNAEQFNQPYERELSVASTTRDRASVRSWSKKRTRRSPCISLTSNNC